MRHLIFSPPLQSVGTSLLMGIAMLVGSGSAYAQSGFHIGPGGIGFGYQDDNFGVIIGNSPYDQRDEYRRDHDHRDHGQYDHRSWYYEPSDYYEAPLEEEQLPEPVIAATGEAAEYQAMAEDAFRSRDYRKAERWSRHALVEDPRNGGLHLFAGQLFFASGDFARSAAAVQRGMALSKREQWGQAVENYARYYSGNDYVEQMADLVAFIKKNPGVPYGYFLRGYHYGFLGHEKAARKDLARAFELESRDQFASELFVMMGGEPPTKPAIAAPRPPADSAAAVTERREEQAAR